MSSASQRIQNEDSAAPAERNGLKWPCWKEDAARLLPRWHGCSPDRATVPERCRPSGHAALRTAPGTSGWALLTAFLGVALAAVTVAGAAEPPKPGELVTLNALSQQWVEDQLWCGQGDVHITYQDMSLRCDEIEVDLKTMHLHAEGNVILDQGQSRMTCSRMEFDLQRKVGTLYNVEAFLPPTYYFRGEEMEKLDETHYRFHRGLFTSCELSETKVTPWSISVSEALVELDGYGHFRDATLKAGSVPVFYTPRLLWPIKRDRATGFLVPNIGYSNQRGLFLGNALFWPISRSLDATFLLDAWSKGYFGLGSELRWAPAQSAYGWVLPYFVWDPETSRWEWKSTGRYNQLFPGGYVLHAELDEVSDLGFFQRFQGVIDRNALRTVYSYASVSRNWGPQTINGRIDHRRTFFTDVFAGQSTEATLNRLGEAEYRLRSTRIGETPFYASGVALADELYVNRTETLYGRYGRFDLNPGITLLSPGFPWLNVTPTVGFRETYYTAQYSKGGLSLVNTPLSRNYATMDLSVVGPSFSRVWAEASGDKIKHLVEPRVDYNYVSNPGDTSTTPIFDEKDSALVTLNRLSWTLANRLFLKTGSGSREIADLEFGQAYSFSEPLTLARPGFPSSQRGAFLVALRVLPIPTATLDARADFDAVTHRLITTSLTGGVTSGGSGLNLTWYTGHDPLTGATYSSQTRVYLALAPRAGPWRLESQTAYDIHNTKLLDQTLAFRWRGSCWSAFVELRDYRTPPYQSRSFRFAIDLTGLGTFLDVRGGLDAMSAR
jgi:LPS-assembly protein